MALKAHQFDSNAIDHQFTSSKIASGELQRVSLAGIIEHVFNRILTKKQQTSVAQMCVMLDLRLLEHIVAALAVKQHIVPIVQGLMALVVIIDMAVVTIKVDMVEMERYGSVVAHYQRLSIPKIGGQRHRIVMASLLLLKFYQLR